MDNTQNVPVNVKPSVAKAPEPTFDNGPSIVGRKERKTGWILAMVLLFIIAAGGVGFGVWAYMDGNTQKENLNAEVNALREQNNTLQSENVTLKENLEVYKSVMARNSNVTILEIDEAQSLDRDGAKAEIIDGKFYIKDSNGEEIIHDDITVVTEIINCSKTEPVEDTLPLVCEVTTQYGQGKFVYTYAQGFDVLKYTLDSWSDEISNNAKVEETSEGVYELDSK